MPGSTAGILTLRFWRAYLITMRPYLLFVSGAAGAVGLAFIPEPVIWRVVLAFFPLFLSYGLGQALTDCFQTDTDSISSPYRPLVRGEVSRRNVLTVSLTGLILGTLIVGYLSRIALGLSALAILGLLTYTFFKRRWWGGPAWNSWIVALLPLIGRHVDSGYRITGFFGWTDPHALAFSVAVAAVFFGYANFVVMGYFKDITADRQTGYDTFPVRFGWVANAIFSDLLAIGITLGAGAAIVLSGPVKPLAGVVFLAGFVINLWAQVAIHRIRDEAKSHGPIANVVRAFVIYGLAMVLALKPGWVIPAVVFYVLFEVVLKLRPEQAQV
ncbi:MAG: UbiA family prenyltransferase [candidate division WOR-3 bacterium]|nr:UbiA family prenyltransferase [candidate division WOR-3 bacterium]